MKKIMCIDIGNTNIVIGVSSDNKDDYTFKHFRITTNHFITVDEVSLRIYIILNYLGIDKNDIKSVIISSVVPEVDIQFKHGIKNLLDIEPIFINSKDIPMEIDYKNLSEIGSDRLVDAYASKVIYGKNSIIVDTGTATTVDVVYNGKYYGGAIMPGIQTSLYAIFQKASKIPKISLETPEKIIGKTTEECLRSGIIIGLAKGIEGIILGIFEELKDNNFKVIFTGGLSDKIFHLVNIPNKIIDKDIMLKGLKIVALEKIKT